MIPASVARLSVERSHYYTSLFVTHHLASCSTIAVLKASLVLAVLANICTDTCQ